MAWSSPRTWVTGELVTAAIGNAHWRDNFLATGVATVTTAGDIVYATAANTFTRLAIGTAATVLRSTGSAPAWSNINVPVPTRCTADQTVANNTFTNSTYLTQAIGASETWMFQYFLRLTTANTNPGGKIAITVPASATLLAVGMLNPSNGIASTTTSGSAIVTLTTGTIVAGAIAWAWVNNSTNAGNVVLQFAQSTTDGANVITLAANSYMVATRVS